MPPPPSPPPPKHPLLAKAATSSCRTTRARSWRCQPPNLASTGHAKVKLTAYDIFTHHRYEDVKPAHAMVEVPVVTRKEFLVVDIDDEDADGGGFLNLFVPESGGTGGEVAVRAREMFNMEGKDLYVVVLEAMNGEMVVDVKQAEKVNTRKLMGERMGQGSVLSQGLAFDPAKPWISVTCRVVEIRSNGVELL